GNGDDAVVHFFLRDSPVPDEADIASPDGVGASAEPRVVGGVMAEIVSFDMAADDAVRTRANNAVSESDDGSLQHDAIDQFGLRGAAPRSELLDSHFRGGRVRPGR